MGCVHPATGRVIAHRTPPRVPEKVRHVVVSVARRFVDPPTSHPDVTHKIFSCMWGSGMEGGGWGGDENLKKSIFGSSFYIGPGYSPVSPATSYAL